MTLRQNRLGCGQRIISIHSVGEQVFEMIATRGKDLEGSILGAVGRPGFGMQGVASVRHRRSRKAQKLPRHAGSARMPGASMPFREHLGRRPPLVILRVAALPQDDEEGCAR